MTSSGFSEAQTKDLCSHCKQAGLIRNIRVDMNAEVSPIGLKHKAMQTAIPSLSGTISAHFLS